MALQKDITTDVGFTTSYHKISEIILNSNGLECAVDSYVSRDYRELERPADRRYYLFHITTEEEESMGIRQLAYRKMKELEAWADAIDC